MNRADRDDSTIEEILQWIIEHLMRAPGERSVVSSAGPDERGTHVLLTLRQPDPGMTSWLAATFGDRVVITDDRTEYEALEPEVVDTAAPMRNN